MKGEDKEFEEPSQLTKSELWDISCMVLAFFCVTSSVTMIVGTGNLIILSVGGSNSLAPFALSFAYLGMAAVGLVTSRIFDRFGRRIGFWFGSACGAVATVISCIALLQSSTFLVLLGQFIYGAGCGVGMSLRYSSVELVPPNYASRAVAWVLGGGCLASFVGPETTLATAGLFGDGNMKYMGTFIGCGFFFLLQSIFVGMVGFPQHKPRAHQENLQKTQMMSEFFEEGENADSGPKETGNAEDNKATPYKDKSTNEWWSIVSSEKFLLPLCTVVFSWIIMVLPMSLFRITMGEVGFTSRQSLTIIEIHFLCMYGPGFWSGKIIQHYGTIRTCQLAVLCNVLSAVFALLVPDHSNSTVMWYISLIFLGLAWHFGFSGATVWSTQSYAHSMHLKPQVQATNDGLMFFLSGSCGLATGYLYEDAGGGGIEGWQLVNYVVLGLCAIHFAILVYGDSVKELHIAVPPDGTLNEPSPEGVPDDVDVES